MEGIEHRSQTLTTDSKTSSFGGYQFNPNQLSLSSWKLLEPVLSLLFFGWKKQTTASNLGIEYAYSHSDEQILELPFKQTSKSSRSTGKPDF